MYSTMKIDGVTGKPCTNKLIAQIKQTHSTMDVTGNTKVRCPYTKMRCINHCAYLKHSVLMHLKT